MASVTSNVAMAKQPSIQWLVSYLTRDLLTQHLLMDSQHKPETVC